jgi:hypothetical protein
VQVQIMSKQLDLVLDLLLQSPVEAVRFVCSAAQEINDSLGASNVKAAAHSDQQRRPVPGSHLTISIQSILFERRDSSGLDTLDQSETRRQSKRQSSTTFITCLILHKDESYNVFVQASISLEDGASHLRRTANGRLKGLR